MSYPYQERLQAYVQGKNVLIFGVGKQGGGEQVATYLASLGAHVRITDMKSAQELAVSIPAESPIEQSLGGHKEEDITWAELIIKNPAVPFNHPLMQLAEQQTIPVTTETTLALKFIRDNTIGITGTRGKTTTTYLIHHLLQASGKHTLIGGNIPQRPTLSLLKVAHETTVFVVEISSFHLEAMDREHISPHHAVVTNIYPDHLNRYASLQAYAETKASIFRWQKPGDHAYWNGPKEWESLIQTRIQEGVEFHAVQRHSHETFSTQLKGAHNQENIALAMEVATTLEIDLPTLQNAVQSFSGVPHRLESIGKIQNIEFINDTTSTTPTALEKAMQAMDSPYILIAGGTTKHLPFSDTLLNELQKVQSNIIWLPGSGTSELLEKLSISPDKVVDTLEDAITTAIQLAQEKNISTILFSPGFTSFEMFDNEFHRGDTFKTIVKSLANQS